MMRPARFVLPVLISLTAAGGALADPPVAATISQPVAPTIAQPDTNPNTGTAVSNANVKGATAIGNYGSAADSKMICKTETAVGSRLGGHRTCMTKADWERQSRNAQDYMNTRIGAPINMPGSH